MSDKNHPLIPAHPSELVSLWCLQGLIRALDISLFALKVAAAVYSHAYSLQFIKSPHNTLQSMSKGPI